MLGRQRGLFLFYFFFPLSSALVLKIAIGTFAPLPSLRLVPHSEHGLTNGAAGLPRDAFSSPPPLPPPPSGIRVRAPERHGKPFVCVSVRVCVRSPASITSYKRPRSLSRCLHTRSIVSSDAAPEKTRGRAEDDVGRGEEQPQQQHRQSSPFAVRSVAFRGAGRPGRGVCGGPAGFSPSLSNGAKI